MCTLCLSVLYYSFEINILASQLHVIDFLPDHQSETRFFMGRCQPFRVHQHTIVVNLPKIYIISKRIWP